MNLDPEDRVVDRAVRDGGMEVVVDRVSRRSERRTLVARAGPPGRVTAGYERRAVLPDGTASRPYPSIPFDLTPAEARAYAAQLIALADAAEAKPGG